MTYKTPGVYVKEISLFPPSVAEVETAIPAFIGYTEKAVENGKSLLKKPTRIKSLLEYHELFGGAFSTQLTSVTVIKEKNYAVDTVEITTRHLYESLRLFFDNGGGKCYIVSVGTYYTDKDKKNINSIANGEPDDPTKPGLLVGLKALEKYDEPTMILFPDAPLMSDGLSTLQQQTLQQCSNLQDRFGIFDLCKKVTSNNPEKLFRDGIGINHLKYGAAYTPWIYSAFPKDVDFGMFFTTITTGVTWKTLDKGSSGTEVDLESIGNLPAALNGLVVTARQAQQVSTSIKGDIDKQLKKIITAPNLTIEAENRAQKSTVTNAATLTTYKNFLTNIITHLEPPPAPGAWKISSLGKELQQDIKNYRSNILKKVQEDINAESVTGDDHREAANELSKCFSDPKKSIMAFIHAVQDAANTRAKLAQQILYKEHPIISNIVKQVQKEMAKVPSSGAIAGVYAMVDRTRGVWKAPANVSLNSVLGPVEIFDDADQKDLNVDVTAGKSINAIRSFSGRGTLVWGARTLAGNDNEWRYVPVRRFYNMVEESIKKSTAWAVFEPNDASLWNRVKGMIDNYLIQKWREGALAGAIPEEAFFVKIGLGQTMSSQDILEGRLVVEIGMAVVRPAEFIVLKFSHKMQES